MAITLNSGFKMPVIGLGVWRMEKQQVRDLIINAIKIGYRHFDCAGTLFSCFILSFSCF
ncbi:NADP-dependent D-sorbitol-6-phosphate dehydrogenase-like [Cucumis melo var. makuwa]|uniref:NADP-dependent D-sorbitol-6-phosphate dehydrogenase-like n=1 Tax=Cucumis melo var. makuwa TaxID=1194695 RepID=A0A5A7UHM0_CUCMM|nr:NADP-dependent D-sorbitol-6-phosphate dehydrogenase-like [Cucumis melo var. makuwa]